MLTIRNSISLRRNLKLIIAGVGIGFSAVAGCSGIDGSDESRLTLEVAASRVSCTGSYPQQCYRVRTLPDTAWTLFYDQIEGFDYETGFTYTISVVAQPIPNPPLDGSGIRYRLLKILRKAPA